MDGYKEVQRMESSQLWKTVHNIFGGRTSPINTRSPRIPAEQKQISVPLRIFLQEYHTTILVEFSVLPVMQMDRYKIGVSQHDNIRRQPKQQ
jgi:hypothetical protein